MNRLNLLTALICTALLAACGGSGGGTEPTVNKAPTVTMESTLTIDSGASITLSAAVSDPEGDQVSMAWQADNPSVSFSNRNESSSLVTFPATSVDLVVILTIVATDNHGNSSQKSITVNLMARPSSNEAPIITMPAEQQAQGGQNIVLIATVQDPQGDNVTVEWHTESTDITFSDKYSLTPSLTLPDVVSELTTLITLTATDEQNNQSEKTLQLTIVPSENEPTASVNIELYDRFDVLSGDVATLSARLTSNVELDSINWDLSSLDITDSSQENVTQDNVTTSTITFTAPTVEELTEFPIKIAVTTMDNTEFISESRIFIAVDSSNTLAVSLPETIEIEESSNFSITPTIESSQAIDSFQWRWLSEPSVTLLTPTNKVLNLLTPAVATDIQGQLELTVVMGNISQTVVTVITIKNKEAISDINVTASRLIAVKGQNITLDVISDNFEQIKQWSWQVSGAQGTTISESNKHFAITAPQVSGQQTMSITYRATLIDDSEVMKIANVTVFSEALARASFTFELGPTPIIYNNIENAFTVTFADPHGLVDQMSLDQSLTSNTFDKAELTRVGDQINIVLKTNTVILDHTDFISFKVAYGDYEQQYPMQLHMRIN